MAQEGDHQKLEHRVFMDFQRNRSSYRAGDVPFLMP